ncbi:MAG: tetratricopeptide repeat protein, partial [Alphaproteobacteria bacterium]
MGDIFREVDEELRQDRVEKLWKQYGKFVIAAAVLIVLGAAGWKFFLNQERDARIAEGAKFADAAALLESGKTAEAATAFATLAGETTSGYGILARLNEASI